MEAFSRDEYDLVTHYATLSEDGTPQTIRSILANEKYKGDALLQKTFTTDFLIKTIKVNDGEVPQYYVTGSHEPIIAPATWVVVQAELARRSGKGAVNTHPFTRHIQCADYGGWFGRKVWHSTSKYRRYIWRCNNKYSQKERCTTPHVSETQIQQAFVTALAEQVRHTMAFNNTMRLLDAEVYDVSELQAQQAQLTQQMEETITLFNQLVTTAASSSHDPNEFDRRYRQLEERHRQLEGEHKKVSAEISNRQHRRVQAIDVRDFLATQPPLEYSDEAWNIIVDHAVVTTDGTISIHLKG